jgi:hypothetical protein
MYVFVARQRSEKRQQLRKKQETQLEKILTVLTVIRGRNSRISHR